MKMKDKIIAELEESAQIKLATARECAEVIEQIADLMIRSLRSGGKIMFCGNGGSAADSQHLAAELIGRYRVVRQSLASIALTVNTSVLTAIGNDYGYEEVFARQIEGISRPGDVLVGISTSGNSSNIIRAMKKAREMGCVTVGFTGAAGGAVADVADVNLAIPSKLTPRIQECHIAAGHIICGIIEWELAR